MPDNALNCSRICHEFGPFAFTTALSATSIRTHITECPFTENVPRGQRRWVSAFHDHGCERNSDLSPGTSIAVRDGSGQDVFEVNIAHAKDQDPVDLPTDSDLDYYGQGDTFLFCEHGRGCSTPQR